MSSLDWSGEYPGGYNGPAVTSLSIARNYAVTKGDLLVVIVIGSTNTTITGVTDGQFGALTACGPVIYDSTGSVINQMWYAIAGASYSASGTNNITATLAAACTNTDVIGLQFSPTSGKSFSSLMAYGGQLQANPGTGVGAVVTPSITPTATPGLAVCSCQAASAPKVSGVAGAFTQAFIGNVGYNVTEYQDLSTIAAFTGEWTSSGSAAGNYINLGAVFFESTPGSPTFISHTEPTPFPTGSYGSLTSPSIAVDLGDLIVVMAGDAGYSNAETRTCLINGQTVTLTKLYDVGQSPGYCGLVAWYGYATATGSITVTVDYTPNWTYSFSVEVWRNAQIGSYSAPVYTSATATAVSMSFSTTGSNSGVAFMSADFSAVAQGGSTLPTTGFTQAFYSEDTTDGYTLTSVYSANVGAPAAYTVGWTNYASSATVMACIEIQYQAPSLPCGYMQAYALW